MKYCNSCGVSVDSYVSNCPLCYTTLTTLDERPEVESYPNLSYSNTAINLMLRILVFISVSVVAVSITINLLNPVSFPWSLVLTISIAYIWIALGTAIKRRRKLGFNLLIQLISLGTLLMIFGYIMDFKQFVYNYIFPALAVSAALSFNILSIIKRKEIQQFLIYYLIVGVLGFLPAIFLGLGKLTVSWPAISCALYCGLSIVSIFVFSYHTTKTELKKRLHL